MQRIEPGISRFRVRAHARPGMTTTGESCGTMARRARLHFTPTPNQWLKVVHPVPARGAYRDRHERGAGCGGRESVGAQTRSQGGLNLVSDGKARRTNDVSSVRQNRVVLTPVAGAKSAVIIQARPGLNDRLHPPTTVTRRIRRRGEHGISRKAAAQGMPGASAEPVCSCAPLLRLRMRPRVQRAPGIPCAL